MKYSVVDFLLKDQKLYYDKITKTSLKWRRLKDKKHKTLVDLIQYFFITRKRNRLAPKRNIWLQGKIGENPKVYHANVIVNRFAKVGKNAIFHGNNCIGNNGIDEKKCPSIGNNVEFGYGAIVIGDIVIADDVMIGAGSVVTKSVLEKGAIVAGVPAKIIKSSNRLHTAKNNKGMV